VVAGVVVLVLVFSLVVAFVSVLADFVVLFASALANFVALFASALADFVEGDEVVFVVFVTLAVVVFGAFEVCEAVVVFFGEDVFGPAVVLGPAFAVFGDACAAVPLDDTCCGFGVDPFLPCAGAVTDAATTNATAVRSAIIVRVMNPPAGPSPNHAMNSKRRSGLTIWLSLSVRALSRSRQECNWRPGFNSERPRQKLPAGPNSPLYASRKHLRQQ
jgi:hypothetical protein